ncbi:MAG: biotin/lipoyl-binding protein [Gammaproteobacteria bacterium]
MNKWSVPTAVLGGVLLIGTLIFTMNYNHPYSEISRQYFVSVPIVPAVDGIVVEVSVEQGQQVEAGDVLFRIDPVPYQNRVSSLEVADVGTAGFAAGEAVERQGRTIAAIWIWRRRR